MRSVLRIVAAGMPTRVQLVRLEQFETGIVVLAASSRLRLRSSNSAWVSHFFEWGIMAGSFEVLTKRESLWHETPTHVRLMGPEWPEMKWSWWTAVKYDAYDATRAKHDAHFVLQHGTETRIRFITYKKHAVHFQRHYAQHSVKQIGENAHRNGVGGGNCERGERQPRRRFRCYHNRKLSARQHSQVRRAGETVGQVLGGSCWGRPLLFSIARAFSCYMFTPFLVYVSHNCSSVMH